MKQPIDEATKLMKQIVGKLISWLNNGYMEEPVNEANNW